MTAILDEHFPGRFSLHKPGSAKSVEVVAGDVERLTAAIEEALGRPPDFCCTKTGEVLIKGEVVLVVDYCGPAFRKGGR